MTAAKFADQTATHLVDANGGNFGSGAKPYVRERQTYGDDPQPDRESDLYRGEFVTGFVDRWDELIDWDARAQSEGPFFIDVAEKSPNPNGRMTAARLDLQPSHTTHERPARNGH